MLSSTNKTSDQNKALNKNALSKGSFFQPKLTVNQPNDVYEQEADAMADHVMCMVDPSANENAFFKPSLGHIQRKCQHCEDEEKLHRKEGSGAEVQGSDHLDNYVSSLGSSGQRLSETSRAFFEPRFGQDFSGVRIHNDAVAARSAQSINALAYTTGNNIVFNQGQYSPDCDSGKRLMAHELTHVVQQSAIEGNVQKKPNHSTPHCAANTNGAPANVLAALQAANARAVTMSLGASLLLFSESLFIQSNVTPAGASTTSTFYHRRFGDPSAAPSGKFRNRFNGTLHNTIIAAKAAEMQSLSTRFERISHFLEHTINFKCADNVTVPIGNCTPFRCGGGAVLASCPTVDNGADIAVCSGFWGYGQDLQAVAIIHETSHMLSHYGDHDAAPYAQSFAQRQSEPECYASLIADIYGVVPFDPSCPVII